MLYFKTLFSDQDGAEPAGNSISALNLLRLSILTEKSEYRSKIDPLFLTFAGRLSKSKCFTNISVCTHFTC